MSIGINAIAAAAGAIPHVRVVDVVFRNPDVDTATVPETVWPLGGLVALRATAAVIEIVSRVAANDTFVTLHGHGLLIGPNADL